MATTTLSFGGEPVLRVPNDVADDLWVAATGFPREVCSQYSREGVTATIWNCILAKREGATLESTTFKLMMACQEGKEDIMANLVPLCWDHALAEP